MVTSKALWDDNERQVCASPICAFEHCSWLHKTFVSMGSQERTCKMLCPHSSMTLHISLLLFPFTFLFQSLSKTACIHAPSRTHFSFPFPFGSQPCKKVLYSLCSSSDWLTFHFLLWRWQLLTHTFSCSLWLTVILKRHGSFHFKQF